MAFPLLAPLLIAGLKILLVKIISLVLVYFIYRVLMAFSGVLIDWAFSFVSSNVDLSDATLQLTGFAAWFAETMRLADVISLLISFCVVRFIIGIVRG